MATRGIVICPPFEITSDGATRFSSTLDPVQLRECALYWDLIDMPDQYLVGLPFRMGRDENLLQTEGIFLRSQVQLTSVSGPPETAYLLAQAAAVERHNREGGAWSIGQTASTLVLPNTTSHEARVAEIELYHAVPVPLSDVRMEDILEFKSKRRDELKRYRAALDALYQDIASSSDTIRSKTHAIEQIQNSLLDLDRVMSESRLNRLRRTIKVELNVSNLARDILLASSASYQFDLPPLMGAGLAIAASALKLSVNSTPMLDRIPAHLKDYAYVSNAREELGNT